MRTGVCDILNIEHPIIQAGMSVRYCPLKKSFVELSPKRRRRSRVCVGGMF